MTKAELQKKIGVEGHEWVCRKIDSDDVDNERAATLLEAAQKAYELWDFLCAELEKECSA